jgi:hypothetical protein
MIGYKHLIECHCILPLYKNHEPKVYHKFPVYSRVSDSGKILPKYSNCNNCGATHLVYELCKSEVKLGSEDTSSVRSVSDVEIALPEKINKILGENNRAIADYEMLEDIFENEIFPAELIVNRNIIDESHHIKILKIINKNKFKIVSEVITTIIKE